tara:strand:- start:228 stop:569 length:342 start_codon:yes stop_codon:yes gene_type:complete
MESIGIVVVYHPNCKPSTDFLIKVSKLTEANIEYINIKDDKIDTQLNIDTVPLMIINNNSDNIFKGKQAFDKVDDLIKTTSQKPKKDITNKYNKSVKFIEETDKKEKIDLSKK